MDALQAIRTIRRCVDEDRYTVRQHVFDRMEQRGLTLPDLLSLVADPDDARTDGLDSYGRERWFLGGRLSDGLDAELLVVVDHQPHATFFTIYWE